MATVAADFVPGASLSGVRSLREDESLDTYDSSLDGLKDADTIVGNESRPHGHHRN